MQIFKEKNIFEKWIKSEILTEICYCYVQKLLKNNKVKEVFECNTKMDDQEVHRGRKVLLHEQKTGRTVEI